MKKIKVKNQRKLGAITLLAVLLLGFSLRTLRIGTAPFQSGDDISVAWASTWYYPRSLETFRMGDGSIEPNPIGIITLIHGPLQPAIAMTWVAAMDKLGLPISETVWHLPFAILGSMVVVFSYWFGRGIQGHRAGIFCAALTAVIPLHVMFSRTSGESHFVLATLFQLISLSAWWRYLSTSKKRFQYITGISIGLDMLVDFMFPGLLVVLAVMTLLYIENPNGNRETIGKAIRLLAQPLMIFAILVGIFYHSITIYLSINTGRPVGMFGRVLSETISSDVNVGGVFIESAVSNLQYATNVLLIISLVLCLGIFFLKKPVRTVSTKTALTWAFVYFVPFIFLIERDRLIGHFIPVAVAGAIFIALVLDNLLRIDSRLIRLTTSVIGTILFTSLLISSLSGVFGLIAPSLIRHPGDNGAVGNNRGTRTAAYWIRKNTSENSIVFSDPFAGQTLSVGMYYYHRPIISQELGPETSPESVAELLEKNIEIVDFLVVGIENRDRLISKFPDAFSPVAQVSVNGEPSLVIMRKSNGSNDEVDYLEAELIDPLYSASYNRLNDIVNLPLGEIQQMQERVVLLN